MAVSTYHAPQYHVFMGQGQLSAKLLKGQYSYYKCTGRMVVPPTSEGIASAYETDRGWQAGQTSTLLQVGEYAQYTAF